MRVDFYFNVEHKLQYACRLVRKAAGAGHGVLAYTRDADRLARFDTALWTFSALDFLPHVYAGTPLAERTPILLTPDLAACRAQRPVLLSLDDDCPPQFDAFGSRFERLLEVVSQEADDRERARARARRYRDAGLPLNHFDTQAAT